MFFLDYSIVIFFFKNKFLLLKKFLHMYPMKYNHIHPLFSPSESAIFLSTHLPPKFMSSFFLGAH